MKTIIAGYNFFCKLDNKYFLKFFWEIRQKYNTHVDKDEIDIELFKINLAKKIDKDKRSPLEIARNNFFELIGKKLDRDLKLYFEGKKTIKRIMYKYYIDLYDRYCSFYNIKTYNEDEHLKNISFLWKLYYSNTEAVLEISKINNLWISLFKLYGMTPSHYIYQLLIIKDIESLKKLSSDFAKCKVYSPAKGVKDYRNTNFYDYSYDEFLKYTQPIIFNKKESLSEFSYFKQSE